MKTIIDFLFRTLLTTAMFTIVALPTLGMEKQDARVDHSQGEQGRTRGEESQDTFSDELVPEVLQEKPRIEEKETSPDAMDLDAPSRAVSEQTEKKEGFLSEEEMIQEIVRESDKLVFVSLPLDGSLSPEEKVKEGRLKDRFEQYKVSLLNSPSIKTRLLEDPLYRKAFLYLNIIDQFPEVWYHLLHDNLFEDGSFHLFQRRLFRPLGLNLFRATQSDSSELEKKIRDKIQQDADLDHPEAKFFLALLILDDEKNVLGFRGNVPKARELLRSALEHTEQAKYPEILNKYLDLGPDATVSLALTARHHVLFYELIIEKARQILSQEATFREKYGDDYVKKVKDIFLDTLVRLATCQTRGEYKEEEGQLKVMELMREAIVTGDLTDLERIIASKYLPIEPVKVGHEMINLSDLATERVQQIFRTLEGSEAKAPNFAETPQRVKQLYVKFIANVARRLLSSVVMTTFENVKTHPITQSCLSVLERTLADWVEPIFVFNELFRHLGYDLPVDENFIVFNLFVTETISQKYPELKVEHVYGHSLSELGIGLIMRARPAVMGGVGNMGDERDPKVVEKEIDIALNYCQRAAEAGNLNFIPRLYSSMTDICGDPFKPHFANQDQKILRSKFHHAERLIVGSWSRQPGTSEWEALVKEYNVIRGDETPEVREIYNTIAESILFFGFQEAHANPPGELAWYLRGLTIPKLHLDKKQRQKLEAAFCSLLHFNPVFCLPVIANPPSLMGLAELTTCSDNMGVLAKLLSTTTSYVSPDDKFHDSMLDQIKERSAYYHERSLMLRDLVYDAQKLLEMMKSSPPWTLVTCLRPSEKLLEGLIGADFSKLHYGAYNYNGQLYFSFSTMAKVLSDGLFAFLGTRLPAAFGVLKEEEYAKFINMSFTAIAQGNDKSKGDAEAEGKTVETTLEFLENFQHFLHRYVVDNALSRSEAFLTANPWLKEAPPVVPLQRQNANLGLPGHPAGQQLPMQGVGPGPLMPGVPPAAAPFHPIRAIQIPQYPDGGPRR